MAAETRALSSIKEYSDLRESDGPRRSLEATKG